jgi:uncharacterized membrane protein
MERVGTWNLALGAAGALAAVATGLVAAAKATVPPQALHSISLHMKWALGTSLLILLLSIWRGAGMRASSRPGALFLILLTAASFALIITGYYGGQNVYDFGVGLHRAQ